MISSLECYIRTKQMLVRVFRLKKEPTAEMELKGKRPAGLGLNENRIVGLERPIETWDFADVWAQITISTLQKATTVGDLSDKIWKSIPQSEKKG